MNNPTTKSLEISSGISILLDSEDYERVAERKWRVEVYELRKPSIYGDIKIDGTYRKISLARFLLNPPAGKRAQKDPASDPLDYRKEHLFIGENSEVKRKNGKPAGKFTSRYKGVYLMGSVWRATLQIDGRTISLGVYDTEMEAAIAYDRAVSKHFGDAAFQNFPKGGVE